MSTNGHSSSSSSSFHFLIVLAWFFVVANLTTSPAMPVPPPDVTNCQTYHMPDGTTPLNCCMPVANSTIIDFIPPSNPTIRIRPAAHLVNQTYIASYSAAVEKMKALGPDHPWNHMQQANIHCAYCNAVYNQTGYPVRFQVHGSWLFFPFHRLYLYFYERILGRLIGDQNFAIPFWNWDAPDGMILPAMYADPSSALYDQLRDKNHQPPTTADLNFDGEDAPPTTNLTSINLRTMYRQMVSGSPTAEIFMGSKYSAGSEPFPGPGALEMLPHGPMHIWTGDRTQRNGEDMGTFYSAGRDPIFYAHHANIDRMWEIWTLLPGPNRLNFNDTDWLDSSFIFWDENLKMVRVKVRDCLDTKKLGYIYQNVPIPWRNFSTMNQSGVAKPPPPNVVDFPLSLSSSVSVEVKRPKVSRTREEKKNEEEVLVVDQIQLDKTAFVKFDVYINAGANDVPMTPESTHFAGSFVNVPMGMENTLVTARMITTRLSLGLTEILDEINADGDSSIIVTFMPRAGADKVMVGGISIELST